MSNFSISHSVFKRLVSQGRQKVLLCGNGLIFSPNDKTWDSAQLKAFADENINVVPSIISVCDGVENILGRVENGGYQHFLLFPQYFQKAFSSRSFKSQDCMVKGYTKKKKKKPWKKEKDYWHYLL